VLAALLWAVVMSQAVSAADVKPFVIAKDGKAVAKVYVRGPLPDAQWLDRPTHERNRAMFVDPVQFTANDLARVAAVTDLVEHIQRITGAKLEVKVVAADDAKPVFDGPAIVLGDLANALGAKPKGTSPSLETFRLIVKPDLILIGGESDVASCHGMYHLLRLLGCEWIMPGEIGTITPTSKNLTLAALDVEEAPGFFIRRLWYRGYTKVRGQQWVDEHQRFNRWMMRQQTNLVDHPFLSARGHYWPELIKKHKQEFDADPTLLALVRQPNGSYQRVKNHQIEAADPRIAKMFADDIRKTYQDNIAKGKWTAQTAAAFPVGPADGLGYSESFLAMSSSANRIDPIVGELDRTDEVILLANRVLEDVTKDYPNAYMGFYSYSVHADFPARYKPHPHLIQIFAPISFSRFHSFLDENTKTQSYYRDILTQWKKLAAEQGNRFWYRGYNWNLAENLLPYTKVRIWGEELPFYRQMGMEGVDVEATKQWGVLAASNYIFMRLAWNPAQDWRELLKHFCDLAYGPASEPMLKYHHLLIDRQHGAGQEAGSYHAFPLIFDAKWIADARDLFAKARKLADNDRQRERIQQSADAVDFLEMFLAFRQATMDFDFNQAQDRYQALKKRWQQVSDFNSDMVSDEALEYFKRFIDDFIAATVKYSNAPYRLVAPLPDQMETLFDPNIVGDRLNYANPQVVIRHPLTTRTYSSTWDAQGLTGIRSGAVWYRHRFDTPKLKDGEALGLMIGGVEDEARVWLNGKLVGGSGRRFSFPFPFDLSEHLSAPGRENLLAIQVIRNSKANEIGLGGIISPCFLFAGPKLDKPAPQLPDIGRILPGGGVE
jgi:hypothetical protein